jgi:glycolate oxidase
VSIVGLAASGGSGDPGDGLGAPSGGTGESRDVLDELRAALGERLLYDPASLAAYAVDSSRAQPEGLPIAVVRATSTADVSTALAWAHARGIRVSVRGAGTGLSGGAVAYASGLVISLEAMNRIVSIDVDNRLADVEAGVVTADLDAAAHAHGLFFPPDPASAEWSTIGGNIATNAGGLRCVAHGVTTDVVAALEVVLADGRIMRTGARTRKNTTGYDLTSLFCGSEGTLGVITAATVRLKPVPPGQPRTFRASFDDIEDAGRAVTAIVSGPAAPEVLELIDARSVEIIEAFHPSGLPSPGAAMLVGQTVGLTAPGIAEEITAICRAHGAVETEVSDSDGLLEARRLANPALTAQGLRGVVRRRRAGLAAGDGVPRDRRTGAAPRPAHRDRRARGRRQPASDRRGRRQPRRVRRRGARHRRHHAPGALARRHHLGRARHRHGQASRAPLAAGCRGPRRAARDQGRAGPPRHFDTGAGDLGTGRPRSRPLAPSDPPASPAAGTVVTHGDENAPDRLGHHDRADQRRRGGAVLLPALAEL